MEYSGGTSIILKCCHGYWGDCETGSWRFVDCYGCDHGYEVDEIEGSRIRDEKLIQLKVKF